MQTSYDTRNSSHPDSDQAGSVSLARPDDELHLSKGESALLLGAFAALAASMASFITL